MNNKPVKKLNTKYRLLGAAFWLAVVTSCGPNPYKSYEKSDPAEDATIALESNDSQRAIDILTKALDKDPSNLKYTSILALAYAQKAGVDPLTLATKLGSSASSQTAATKNGVTSLFSIMPVATNAAIADVDKAVALLTTIPAAKRGTYDTLKLAMFQTAAMTLRAKILDTNGDGVLSTAELLAMSTTSATAILSQLAAAASTFSTGGTTSTTDKLTSDQIAQISAAIASQPGATDADKLKSYLGKSST